MQGNNGQQGNQGGGQQKSGGLSWTQSPSQTPVPPAPANTAKPISQVSTPPVQTKASTIPNGNKNMSSNNNNKNHSAERNAGGAKFLWPFLAGVIVGLIIGWGWFSLRTDTEKVTSMASSTTTTATATPGSTNTGSVPSTTTTGGSKPSTISSGALTISPMQDAGLQVGVSSISVSQPTWVVIFDNNGGRPGNALGAAMFFPGDKAGSVELLRGTVSGQTYLAGEYVDDGDHLFSKQKDMQVSGITGSPVLVEFSVR